MFSLYIDKNALSKICKENAGKDRIEEQSPWYRIIAMQDKVYANIGNRLSNINDYEDQINEIENSENPDVTQIKELVTFRRFAALNKDVQTLVLPCSKVDIDSIDPSMPSTFKNVVNDPCAVYLLNIKPEDAAKIQKEYGVICQSINALDDSILTGEGIHIAPKKGNDNYGWLRVMKNFKNLPSSAIVINDRNLFTNDRLIHEKDGSIKEEILGIQNVKEVLDQVVPKHYNGGKYHILISSDITNQNDGHVTFDYVNKKLEEVRLELVKSRKKRFDIDLELFVFYSDQKSSKPNGLGHEDTHNRRILSNYFIFTFEHKIKAFNGEVSLITQDINGHKLFHVGLYDDGNDPAEKTHHDMIAEFSDFLSAHTNVTDPTIAANLDSTVRYSLNGVEQKPSQVVKMNNRILFP